MTRAICLIANHGSGTNARDTEAIDRALSIFGDAAWMAKWSPGTQPMSDVVDEAISKGADLIVAAGGDGTAMALADTMVGRGVAMAVLPLGTFNYFTRGLGLSEEPDEAAAQIRDGQRHDITVGDVNGQVFLNNASLGVYPNILRERESVYGRWGRFRLAAHWSVVKTFLRFRKPMRVTLTLEGTSEERRSALIFVARSAYQLASFGVDGRVAIEHDEFAILIARAETRMDLLRMTARLALSKPLRGRDYELLTARSFDIETAGRTLIAYDGEKDRASGPFRFRMRPEPLTIIVPAELTQ